MRPGQELGRQIRHDLAGRGCFDRPLRIRHEGMQEPVPDGVGQRHIPVVARRVPRRSALATREVLDDGRGHRVHAHAPQGCSCPRAPLTARSCPGLGGRVRLAAAMRLLPVAWRRQAGRRSVSCVARSTTQGSICRQPFRPEDRARSRSASSGDGGSTLVKRVLQAEPLPLEPAHLVERQHLDALDVAEPGREAARSSPMSSQVVGQARHQHEAHPDRPLPRGQPPRERRASARRPSR